MGDMAKHSECLPQCDHYNGYRTIEADYSQFHPNILYHLHQAELTGDDAYERILGPDIGIYPKRYSMLGSTRHPKLTDCQKED